MRVIRRGKARREPLAPMVRRYFETGDYAGMTGPGWFNAFQISGQIMNVATRGEGECQEWLEHGETITAEWARRHPGSRPFAWRVVDAPEVRRCLRGAELLLPKRAATDWNWHWRMHFGIPAFVQCRPSGFDGYPEVESEAAYLNRHGLLSRAERARCGDDAFEPEAVDPFITDEGELDDLIARGDARRAAERLAMRRADERKSTFNEQREERPSDDNEVHCGQANH